MLAALDMLPMLVILIVSILAPSSTALLRVGRTIISRSTITRGRIRINPALFPVAKLGKTSLHDTTSTFSLLTSVLQKVPKSQAQSEFYFFFFGGSGALGLGFAQLPKLLSSYKALQDLKGGPSKGGDNLKCGPVVAFGLPEPIKRADVQYIIDNLPTAEEIDKKGKKVTFIAQSGYLEREAFYDCLPKANPVALYAAFNALGQGNTDFADPNVVTAKRQRWQQPAPRGTDAFVSDLQIASLKKASAFTVFALLIALVLDLIVESGQNAFF